MSTGERTAPFMRPMSTPGRTRRNPAASLPAELAECPSLETPPLTLGFLEIEEGWQPGFMADLLPMSEAWASGWRRGRCC